jgi:hypothetical protein
VDAKFSETKWSGKFSETSATLVSNLHNYSRSSRDLLVKKAKMKLQMSTCLAVPSKSKTFITLWPLVHPLYLCVSSSDLFSKINFVIHLTIPLSTPHIFYFKKLFVFQHWILSCLFHLNILVRLWSLVSKT